MHDQNSDAVVCQIVWDQDQRTLVDSASRETDGRAIACLTVGAGWGYGHVGEIYQGAVPKCTALNEALDSSAPMPVPQWQSVEQARAVTHVLIDLPCNRLRSRVDVRLFPVSHHIARPIAGPLRKSWAAAELTLEYLGVGSCDIEITVRSNIPSGKGYGSSSADVVATIRAVANALRLHLSDSVVSRLLCLAEGASNPAHLARPVLFAHREGRTVLDYRVPWPKFAAIGIEFPGDVLTDAFVPLSYDRESLKVHAELLTDLTQGFLHGDLKAIAHVSSEVATADSRLSYDHAMLTELVSRYGAAGYVVAHSGAVAAILWPMNPEGIRVRDRVQRELTSSKYAVITWES